MSAEAARVGGPVVGTRQERDCIMVASTSARRRGARLGVVACLSAGLVAFAGGRLRAQAASPPAGASSLPAQEPLSALPGESAFPLQVTGFGVADYRADGRTKDNSFEAGKLAVSLFRELTDHVWAFGKITHVGVGAAAASADGEGAVTDIEIDNFIIQPDASVAFRPQLRGGPLRRADSASSATTSR